jgi:hypothetical protein
LLPQWSKIVLSKLDEYATVTTKNATVHISDRRTDLAIADAHATFGVTCRRWNIGLADGGTQRLTRIREYRRAIELIITGRVIDARGAERIGLVNEVVGSGTCLRRALELAEAVAALPQPALRTDLQAARTGQGRPLDEGLRIEAQCFNRSIFASETFEGLRQFNERDHPDRRADTAPITPACPKQLPSESALRDGRTAFVCRSPAGGNRSAGLDPTKGSAVSDNSRAYNSVWQLRGDAWCPAGGGRLPTHPPDPTVR